DRYIVGQADAKRAVAIALRNRWRRQKVAPELRDEIAPKNILMIGPTGVGKTEISRRLAKLAQAPFLKVEASKYTEVGYDGRDVEIETTAQAMPMVEVFTPQGMEEMGVNMKDLFSQIMPKKTKKRSVKIPEALEILTQEEAARLVDMESVAHEAIGRAEQS